MASGPWSGHGNPAIGHTVKGIATKVLPAAMVNEHFAEKDPAAEVEGIVTESSDGRSVKVTWKVALMFLLNCHRNLQKRFKNNRTMSSYLNKVIH